MFFESLLWSINLVWSFIFITKYINGNITLFFYFCKVCFMNRKFYFFKTKLFVKSLSTFLNFSGFLFTGFKYLTKHELQHSLSSFWILIRPFNEIFPSLSNRKQELLSQGAISEIASWCCNIELIVQPDLSYVQLSTLDES